MDSWKKKKCLEILRMNHFPDSLSIIAKFRNPSETAEIDAEAMTSTTNEKYRSMVYIKGVSEKISKIIKKTVKFATEINRSKANFSPD